MITINGFEIKPTIFPDKTSQVWRISEDYFRDGWNAEFTWEFENEAEFIHLAQAVDLVRSRGANKITLRLPYLPYARQDKKICNDATFALHTFCNLLNSLNFVEVSIIDAHNKDFCKIKLQGYKDLPIHMYLATAIGRTKCTMLCYPDAGAKERYKDTLKMTNPLICSFSKERDQQTGEIKRLYLNELVDIKDQIVLICDDLCDGGMTFIKCAERLYELGAKEVHLYTTHGLYTKGTQVLIDNGIKRIFNKTGEVK